MRVVVIEPAEPIVDPSDVSAAGADEDHVERLILTAQSSMAGPRGWLGCSLGAQTLEVSICGWWHGGLRLPHPPILNVVSVDYRPAGGDWTSIDDAMRFADGDEVWLDGSFARPPLGPGASSVRVRYRAGYEIDDVPMEAKQAVIEIVQDMLRIAPSGTVLRSENVEGVGSFSYVDPDKLSTHMRTRVQSLVSGLRIPVL